MKSTEMNVRAVQIKIAEMMDSEEIRSFISGDERKTVIDAAHKRIIEMMGKPASVGKAGETGPITGTKSDFKEGVQRTKCDDQNPPSDSPLTKGGDRGVMEKFYITCEDVLKNLRVKGYIHLPLNLSLLKFNEEKR